MHWDEEMAERFEKKVFLKEEIRIEEMLLTEYPTWDMWGPYLAERAWGTVREDYSKDGDAWNYLSYDQARDTAYRWSEDGIAGLTDRYQTLIFSLGFWNHKDDHIKERLMGLTPSETNHGEDVKEYYFYLDNTPTHSYMRYLYKYPQSAFPYDELRSKSKALSVDEPEYELLDTGIFDDNRYFDIYVEYAKMSEEDIAIKIEICNRADVEASIDLIPQLYYRNFWKGDEKPEIYQGKQSEDFITLTANQKGIASFPMLEYSYDLGKYYLYAENGAEVLFTENETGEKGAFHRHIVDQEPLDKTSGTKAGLYYRNLKIPARSSRIIHLRLSSIHMRHDPLADIEEMICERRKEADRFYEAITPSGCDAEDAMIFRQALAGLLWNKQAYFYIVNYWLKEKERQCTRNDHWRHFVSKDILVMPDCWEYPWFAAWDLSFHSLILALVDLEGAKRQIWFLLTEQSQHPNGSIAAYEWEFSDLNPPNQAWCLYELYKFEKEKKGRGDFSFLKQCYHKIVLNFVCWVNQVDRSGNNIFEGGFLGLDNISVIDRSQPLPDGGTVEQSDGTGWMALFCLDLMRIAFELSKEEGDYECMITKFFQHFIYISSALTNCPMRSTQNWNEEDGFFYDLIGFPDGTHEQIPIRSLVGIIPLFAIEWISKEELLSFESFRPEFEWVMNHREDLAGQCITEIEKEGKIYYLFSVIGLDQIKRILQRLWDPKEFRSKYGLRSLSKMHHNQPVELFNHRIAYEPAESRAKIYGGNSNWRGPIWLPMNYMLIQTLERLYDLLGDTFTIQIDGEKAVNLHSMAKYFANALIDIFKRKDGKRAVHGEYQKFHEDPIWQDLILFYEYFDGDTGRGCGASHQTGWTALIANLIDKYR